MKVLVVGASGVIGRQLVPMLVASGHEVVGMTRSESKTGVIRETGAEPLLADALDAAGVDAGCDPLSRRWSCTSSRRSRPS